MVGSPLPGLSLRGQYSYLDNRISAIQDINFGKRLANMPMHTAALWANYVVQSGPVTGFGFGGGVRYVHDMYTTNANNLTVPTIVPGELRACQRGPVQHGVRCGALLRFRDAVSSSGRA